MDREYLYPKRIIDSKNVGKSELLVKERTYLQIGLNETEYATLTRGSFVILDFGRELCGGVRILTYRSEKGLVRIRFGESVSECCADIGQNNASNDHSPRDFTEPLVDYSDLTFGQSGFRFVRLDVLCGSLQIKSIVAAAFLAETKRNGYFFCSDNRLNDIFETSAYTLELCQRNGMLWDGIKRDRLVWGGDLHVQMLGTLSLFDAEDTVRNSLRFLREQTPLPAFMNGIPIYSLWWIMALIDYYMYTGDVTFLKENECYVKGLIDLFVSCIDDNGDMHFDGVEDAYFFDLDTYRTEASRAGVYAVAKYVFDKIGALSGVIGIDKAKTDGIASKIRGVADDGRKIQIRAIYALGCKSNDYCFNPYQIVADDLTIFMSYYIFSAMSEKKEGVQAVRLIKEYYGAMLDLGATTFWEEFKMPWAKNSIRLDEIPDPAKKDFHADYGMFCFKGLRRSLCHGWSASPIPFVVKYILGIKILEPGYKKILVSPNLCGLQYAEGHIPTPYGEIKIYLKKNRDFTLAEVTVPQGVTVITEQTKNVRFITKICEN